MPVLDRPWRKVVQVDHTEGPRGGQVWFLTLECGHHKAVRIPPFRLHRMTVFKEAPERCRCVICEATETE